MIYLPLPTTKEQCTSFVNTYKHNLASFISSDPKMFSKFIDYILEKSISHYGVTEEFTWVRTKEQLSTMTPYKFFPAPKIF